MSIVNAIEIGLTLYQMSFLYTKLPDNFLGKLDKMLWEL